MDIRLEMRTALWPLARHAELERRVREAGELAERAGDDSRHAVVFNYLTAHYWQAGEHERAIEHGERGISLAQSAGNFSARVTTQQHLGLAFHARGEFLRQVELHRQVAKDLTGPQSLLRHGMSGYPAVITRAFLAWGLAELGDFDEALSWGERGIEIANQVNSAMSTVWVTDYLALVHIRRGEFDTAIALLEPNLELCKRAEVRLLATNTHGILGLACCAAGRQADAISLLEHAVSPESLAHHPQGSGYPLVWLAEAYLGSGRLADAAAAVASALETARHQGERGHEAWARYLDAEIERTSGAPAASVAAYRQALELARDCGMRPLSAHGHLGLARAMAAEPEGKPDQRELDTARGLFDDMGMRYWLDRCAN